MNTILYKLMLYQQAPSQIATKLIGLSSKDLTNLIKQNDEMLLTWNQSQLFRKWPRSMVPGGQKTVSNNILFTGMLENTKQKAYQYHNLVEPIDYVFEKKQNLDIQPINNDEQFQVKQEEGDKQLAENNVVENEPNNADNQQKIEEVRSLKASTAQKHQFQFGPFLPNRENPFDRNANSKSLKYKFENLKLDNRKRNIVAMVQGSKSNNEKFQHFKYGRSAPKKATDSIDITDILKYTLGIKKQKEQNIQPPPIKNPFVRVPQKYYETMGDFYGGFAK